MSRPGAPRAELWRECGARLVEKTLAQLSFEALLDPVPADAAGGGTSDGGTGGGTVGWVLELPGAAYGFRARRSWFGALVVVPGSVRRSATGVLGDTSAAAAHDVAQLLRDVGPAVGVAPDTLAGFVAETTATLAADVELAATGVTAAELAELALSPGGHHHVDGHLGGHPWLVANKGRVGFSAADLARHAPESRRPVRLPWLAVQRGLAEFRGTPALSEDAVRTHQLGSAGVAAFRAVLTARGLDPDTYVWLPVHPWQLDHVVRTLWAPELGAERVVELGEADTEHLPTQSIRTLDPLDDGTEGAGARYQVKLPLRILNTAVWRGIPTHCSLAAPAITQWLRGLWDADPDLAAATLLGEVASVTVPHPHLNRVEGVPYHWTETLGCLWREPVGPTLGPDERAWPLAAVLHRDPAGADLLGELAARSGLDPLAWVQRLVAVALPPLLTLLYRYGTTVNPHGENVVVVSDPCGTPLRIVLKDLVDDVNVSADPVPERGPEPDSDAHVLPRKPWSVLKQYLVDAFLVGVLRPLVEVLEEAHGADGAAVWAGVRAQVLEFRAAHPELAERVAAGDLLAAELPRYPLNGDRLLQTGYADRAVRHAIAPAGTIPNPLASP